MGDEGIEHDLQMGFPSKMIPAINDSCSAFGIWGSTTQDMEKSSPCSFVPLFKWKFANSKLSGASTKSVEARSYCGYRVKLSGNLQLRGSQHVSSTKTQLDHPRPKQDGFLPCSIHLWRPAKNHVSSPCGIALVISLAGNYPILGALDVPNSDIVPLKNEASLILHP